MRTHGSVPLTLRTGPGLLDDLRQSLARTFLTELANPEARALVTLAVQEVVANVWEHGYRRADNEPVEVEITPLEGEVFSVTVSDRAPVLDVTRAAPRSLRALAARHEPRGRGIALVRELTLSLTHRPREGGGNLLTLVFDPALITSVLEGRMNRAG